MDAESAIEKYLTPVPDHPDNRGYTITRGRFIGLDGEFGISKRVDMASDTPTPVYSYAPPANGGEPGREQHFLSVAGALDAAGVRLAGGQTYPELFEQISRTRAVAAPVQRTQQIGFGI